jgi:uncharacterized protein
MRHEERRLTSTEFRVRNDDAGNVIIEGYAAVFNSRSQNLGGFVEQIAPGAFKKTIKEADVKGLVNHDPNKIIGRSRAGMGTLRLSEDSQGLQYEIDLPNTSYARDLAESMRRGDITESSFGFRTIKDDWGFTDDDFPLRTLQEVSLFDVSPVTYPAYLATSSAVAERALESLAETRGMEVDAVKLDIKAAIIGETDEPATATLRSAPYVARLTNTHYRLRNI